MSITVRVMQHEDIDFGMRLKNQVGWNQTRRDWERFLALEPEGCFVAEYQGTPAGTTVVSCFGNTAWIAMVLVDEALRGRGIGRALVEHALRYLERRNIRTVRLDATPLGRLLYERLGFQVEYSLTRFGGKLTKVHPACASPVTRAEPCHLQAVCEFDRSVTNADRSRLLAWWWHDSETQKFLATEQGKVIGYALVRPGSAAWFIGPILASPAVAPALLSAAINTCAGKPVYIDVPDYQTLARCEIQAAGLTAERPLYRMWLGETRHELRSYLYASSGPECG